MKLGDCMSKNIYCRFLVLIGLCFTLLGLVSCGWPVTETKTYHAPNWTPDGRIVAEVQVVKLQRTLISNSEYVGGYTGIVIMDKDGSNEELLFETPTGGVSRIEMSPSGNYVGVISGWVLDLYSSSGQLLQSIVPDPIVDHIKFSPDETKLYGSEFSVSMSFFDVPSLDLLLHNELGGSGIWHSNNTILYRDRDIVLALFNFSTSERFLYDLNMVPEIYLSSSGKVLSFGAGERYEYTLGESEETNTPFSYSPYNYQDFTNQQLSPDGKEIVMGAKSIFSNAGAGIYILDIENGGITFIK